MILDISSQCYCPVHLVTFTQFAREWQMIITNFDKVYDAQSLDIIPSWCELVTLYDGINKMIMQPVDVKSVAMP